MLFASVGAFAAAAPAAADSPAAGGDLSIAQTLGDRELTVVLRRVTSVPGPLQVEVVTHAGTAAGRLTIEVTPTGVSSAARRPAPGAPTDHGAIDLGATPGMYSTTVWVDRAGPWELAVGDGSRTARIPFLVPAQIATPPERFVYGGFVVAGVALPVAAVVAIRARHSAWALVPAAGVVAGVAVAVTAAVLSATLPLPPQPGVQVDPDADNVADPYAAQQPRISDFSRPPVLLAVVAESIRAGEAADLDLDLVDAATGNRVDDLIVHDDALIHALVVGPSGQLAHLHPIRTGPGRYQLHVTAPEPGHYALSTELVRRGGGVQTVRAATGFDVAVGATSGREFTGGRSTPPGGAQSGLPTRAHASAPADRGPQDAHRTLVASADSDGTPITVTATAAVAGVPTTLTAKVGDRPELQPWLGMVGHLVVAGPLPGDNDLGTAVQNAPIWGHAHSMGAMSMGGMAMETPGPDSGMTAADHMSHGSGSSAELAEAMLMPSANGDSPPDETVAAYGPTVPFTYTFALPGRYRLWLQVERRYTVLTIPVVLDVAPGSAR